MGCCSSKQNKATNDYKHQLTMPDEPVIVKKQSVTKRTDLSDVNELKSLLAEANDQSELQFTEYDIKDAENDQVATPPSINLHVFGDKTYKENESERKFVAGIKHLSCGRTHNILSDHTNTFFVNGSNRAGQCGIGKTDERIIGWRQTSLFQNTKIKKVCTSIHNANTFWITSTGKVFGNGYNNYAILGVGDHKNRYSPEFITDLNDYNVLDIQGGASCNIALCGPFITKCTICTIINYWTQNAKLNISDCVADVIWNHYSQYMLLMAGYTGYFDTENVNTGWCVIESLINKSIISVSCGWDFSMFLDLNGRVYASGNNYKGQLGLGYVSEDHDLSPTPIPNVISYVYPHSNIIIKQIATGSNHTLCIDATLNVYSWGGNEKRQCGQDTSDNVTKPQIIIDLLSYNIATVKCGDNHSYAYCLDDNVHFLFGYDCKGQCSLKHKKYFDHHAIVAKPLMINDIFKEITGDIIKEVYMGMDQTFIVAHK